MIKNEANSGSPFSSSVKIFSPVRKLSQVFSRIFRRTSESGIFCLFLIKFILTCLIFLLYFKTKGVKRNLIRFESEENEIIYPLEEQSKESSKSSRSARRRHTGKLINKQIF
jgi:hypothetical protein